MAALRFLLCITVCLAGFVLVIGQGIPPDMSLGFNPCLEKACHSYATCKVVNGSQAVCVCPQNCTAIKQPVCGANWKTYDNLCSLLAESCQRNEWNSLQYNGECTYGDCRSTIWRITNCPWYSTCKLHFGFPRCVCPKEECPMDYDPVCATDGRTYRNMCRMRYSACRKRKLLRVRNRGHCKPDPCRLHECCCGAACRVNETNYASCSCDFTCSGQSNPVCGNDGQTYNSPCDLRLTACRQQNMKLGQVSVGPCFGQGTTPSPGSKTNACLHQICSYHGICVVDRGQPRCVCPICPLRRAEVCGSDGVTYDNECQLRRASCVSMRTITVARNESCAIVPPTLPIGDLCSLGQCAHYARCIVIRGVPQCVCPDLCPRVASPICGSDGRTYENDCAMRRESCKFEKTITLRSRGPCPVQPTTEPVKPTMDPCFDQSCTYHAECIVEQGLPKCVCPSNCPNTSSAICGSDGITYGNDCHMRRASCNKQITISISSSGSCVSPCDTTKCCCGSVCKMRNNTATCVCDFLCSSQYDPVCGSDGKTYGNECELRLAACKTSDANLKQKSRGECPIVTPTRDPCALGMCAYHAKCQVIQGQPRCVCPDLCPTIFTPKCGSDGKTYQNECSLKRASCDQQVDISVAKNGPCNPPPTTQPPTSAGIVCGSLRCEHFSTCQIIQGVHTCVCPSLCPQDTLMMCGSDGKTYDNECALKRTSCLAGRIISIVRIGVCLRTNNVAATQAPRPTQPTPAPTSSNPCAFGICAHHGVCQVHQGQPRCVCPTCTAGTRALVCGSDGRTYDSECELKKSSCISQKAITVVNSGSCEPVGRCPTPQLCNQQCDHDICARSGKLCCCQGCAKGCTTPVWSLDVRQYVCPADPLGCRNDADCNGGFICCNTGCTNRCIAPRV